MNNKLFKIGAIIGGFQPLHLGHEELINTGLQLCEHLYIYIGQRKTKEENIFSFKTRKNLIEKVYKNNLSKITILQNEYREKELWGNYLLDLFDNTIKEGKPNIIIHGDEDFRRIWFSQSQRKGINELFMPRKETYNVSGTLIRKALIEENYNYCEVVMNNALHNDLPKLRKELLQN